MITDAVYFCQHFEFYKKLFWNKNKYDASSIEKADLLNDSNVKLNLIYIHANFSTLPDNYWITRLETSSKHASIEVVKNLGNKIQQNENRIGREIKKKLYSVLDKKYWVQNANNDFQNIKW